MERDTACQEHTNAWQWIGALLGKVTGEQDLKIVAEEVSARLAAEVGEHQEEIRRLRAKVT